MTVHELDPAGDLSAPMTPLAPPTGRRPLDEFSAARIRLLFAELDALDPDAAADIALDPMRGPLLKAAHDLKLDGVTTSGLTPWQLRLARQAAARQRVELVIPRMAGRASADQVTQAINAARNLVPWPSMEVDGDA